MCEPDKNTNFVFADKPFNRLVDIHWRRLARSDRGYFKKRRLIIRECLANIHNAVSSLPRSPTSVERIVWILVCLIFAALIFLAAFTYSTRASYGQKMLTVRADQRIIELALQSYYLENGRYPFEAEGITALLLQVPPTNSNRRLRINLLDPWGNPYVYQTYYNGQMCIVTSLGKDGKPGGNEKNKDIWFHATKIYNVEIPTPIAQP